MHPLSIFIAFSEPPLFDFISIFVWCWCCSSATYVWRSMITISYQTARNNGSWRFSNTRSCSVHERLTQIRTRRYRTYLQLALVGGMRWMEEKTFRWQVLSNTFPRSGLDSLPSFWMTNLSWRIHACWPSTFQYLIKWLTSNQNECNRLPIIWWKMAVQGW